MWRVAEYLRNQGITVWVDTEKLVPGTPIWEEEIDEAITNAGAVVVLLTPDSKSSPWVRREIGYAEDHDRRIFPIMIERIDLRNHEEEGLMLLTEALSSYLKELENVQDNNEWVIEQEIHKKNSSMKLLVIQPCLAFPRGQSFQESYIHTGGLEQSND